MHQIESPPPSPMCLSRRWGSNMADMLRAKTWACTTILLQGALIFGQFSKEIQAFKVVVEHVKRYKTQDMHSNRIGIKIFRRHGSITRYLFIHLLMNSLVRLKRLEDMDPSRKIRGRPSKGGCIR
ncbi:hypothetical protein D1007_20399 [Hordeum vulgare]|nr:hypothetical protein D1007_20399 [Hordeum vulgare]